MHSRALGNVADAPDASLALSLPLGTRELLTILRKLYARRGSGRRESALYRGLDPRAQQLVEDVLRSLRREGFAIKSKQAEQAIWLPSHISRMGDAAYVPYSRLRLHQVTL